MIYYRKKSSDSFKHSVACNSRERGIGPKYIARFENVNGMRDLSATGGSGIRQNLGTDVRLGKKTFFGMATTKEVGVRDQDSPFQTLTPGGEGYSLR